MSQSVISNHLTLVSLHMSASLHRSTMALWEWLLTDSGSRHRGDTVRLTNVTRYLTNGGSHAPENAEPQEPLRPCFAMVQENRSTSRREVRLGGCFLGWWMAQTLRQ